MACADILAAALAALAAAPLMGTFAVPEPLRAALLGTVAASAAAYCVAAWLVPTAAGRLEKKGLYGKDLGQRHTALKDRPVPEALGIVCGAVFLVAVLVLHAALAAAGRELDAGAHQATAGLLSICLMVLLGFVDDVLDVPWRVKVMLPGLAALPLLAQYEGPTSVVVPIPLRALLAAAGPASGAPAPTAPLTALGALLDSVPLVTVDAAAGGAILELGGWYLVYMALLAIFCTNAINIYAGVNGLEAGQALVIALAALAHNAIEVGAGSSASAGHALSATLLMPLAAVTLALLRYNWYPAQVFVGDTFCYFSGMAFAVAAIQGHFSKTLLLLLLPQLANFAYSVPQLFKLVPCPRHRLPGVDPATGLRVPSTFECAPGSLAWRLLRVARHTSPVDGVERCGNLTLINLALQWGGPMREEALVRVLLALQVACCAAGLGVRYFAAGWLFDG